MTELNNEDLVKKSLITLKEAATIIKNINDEITLDEDAWKFLGQDDFFIDCMSVFDTRRNGNCWRIDSDSEEMQELAKKVAEQTPPVTVKLLHKRFACQMEAEGYTYPVPTYKIPSIDSEQPPNKDDPFFVNWQDERIANKLILDKNNRLEKDCAKLKEENESLQAKLAAITPGNPAYNPQLHLCFELDRTENPHALQRDSVERIKEIFENAGEKASETTASLYGRIINRDALKSNKKIESVISFLENLPTKRIE